MGLVVGFILVFIFLFIGIGLIALGTRSLEGTLSKRRAFKKLRQEGVRIYGRITAHNQAVRYRRTNFYSLMCSYEYQGKSYSSSQPVNHDQYTYWPDGQSMPIRVLPEHPEMSCLDEKTSQSRLFSDLVDGIGLLIFGIIISIIFGVLLGILLGLPH